MAEFHHYLLGCEPFSRKHSIGDDSEDGDKGKRYIALKSVMAGGVAGGLQQLITYPMEYIKTQLQLDVKGTKNHFYNNISDVAYKTYRAYGFSGFFRGVGVTMFGVVPRFAARFFVLEYLRNYFVLSTGYFDSKMKFLTGLSAGTLEAIAVVTPFETLKVKFIHNERSSSQQHYRGIVHGVSTIIKNEGIGGVYQGLTPTIVKEGSNQAIRFLVVQSLMEKLTDGDLSTELPVYWTGSIGGVAGFISVLCNNPIDVIKTRMQSHDANQYKNTLDCAIKIWLNEGASTFYTGLVPRSIRVSFDVAITFMFYDRFMHLLNKLF